MFERWAIALGGNQMDLRDALQVIAGDGPVRVREIPRPDGSLATAMMADELEGVPTFEDAHEIGKRLIAWLNGALFVRYVNRQRLTLAAVVERDEAGNWLKAIAPGVGLARGRSRAWFVGQAIGPDGHPMPSSRPPHSLWFELATADEAVADVLVYLSRELDWFDLYKAYEHMRSDVEKGLRSDGLPRRNHEAMGWPSKAIRNVFTESANVHRHAKSDWPKRYTLANAMALDDARQMVRELAEKWLAWRVSRLPP